MDHELFAAINGWAGRERVVDTLSVALSRFGPFLLLVALGMIWFHPTMDAERERRRRLILLAALATAGSLLVNQILFGSGADHVHSLSRLPRSCFRRRMTLLFPATMQRLPSRSP